VTLFFLVGFIYFCSNENDVFGAGRLMFGLLLFVSTFKYYFSSEASSACSYILSFFLLFILITGHQSFGVLLILFILLMIVLLNVEEIIWFIQRMKERKGH